MLERQNTQKAIYGATNSFEEKMQSLTTQLSTWQEFCHNTHLKKFIVFGFQASLRAFVIFINQLVYEAEWHI
ncbi:MAG TPA: hypothetical protein VEF04_13545 [Blastocatellia bacterium]|nr:hypothetical protein [Blastocatellia bacterium]